MTGIPAQSQPDIAQRLGEIAVQLSNVVDGMKELTGYGKRTRRLTWFAILSLVFDVILTVAFAWVLSVSQANACHASNDARAGQVVIWHTLVGKFTQPHPSKKQQLQQQQFLNFVDHTFQPLHCRSIYLP